jgi:hypothetical protein
MTESCIPTDNPSQQDRDEAWDLAAQSPANRAIRDIMERGEKLYEDLAVWLNAGHGAGCKCAWCAFDDGAADVREELAGVYWALTAIVQYAGANGPLYMMTDDEIFERCAKRTADEPRIADAE